jgi:acylphosphatase
MDGSSEIARIRLKIAGRVQGVYYRASALQEALNLGLTGWVMNCPDGSVEAIAEGAKPALEQWLAWCGRGPTGARVSSVDVRWEPPENCFSNFTIRR